MIYLLLLPDALEVPQKHPGPLSKEQRLRYRTQLQRLLSHIAALGELAHSPMLPDDHVILLTTKDLTRRLHRLLFNAPSWLKTDPVLGAELRAVQRLLTTRYSKVLALEVDANVATHVGLDHPTLGDNERNLTVEVEPAPSEGQSLEDLKWALGCLLQAIERCDDQEGAAESVLILGTNDATSMVEASIAPDHRRQFRVAPDLGCHGKVVSRASKGLAMSGHRLLLPSEDHPEWRQAMSTSKDVGRSLNSLCSAGHGRCLPGKGDHVKYALECRYIPWANQLHLERLEARGLGVPTAAGGSSRKNRTAVHLSETITFDAGRSDFPPSYSDQYHTRLGLTKPRTWWLLYGGRKGRSPKRLADVLREIRRLPESAV